METSDPNLMVRTARKRWECKGCGVTIEPGVKYLEYLGESPAYQSGSRYCDICAEDFWGMDAAYFARVHNAFTRFHNETTGA